MNNVFARSCFFVFISAAVFAALLFVPTASNAQLFNTETGFDALANNTSGNHNTADGYQALFNNVSGPDNTAIGAFTLFYNHGGGDNTAIGMGALNQNTTGNYNTASGYLALQANTSANYNTANGFQALYSNTTGPFNTANGYTSLYSNTTGGYNTANGGGALYYNTAGADNTAHGYAALYANSTGNGNTSNGFGALYKNVSGNSNVADGLSALYMNTLGSNNVAIGADAGLSITGTNNIALGYGAGQNITSSGNNIAIGNAGMGVDSGAIRIGTKGIHTSTFIAGINGVAASGGVAVYINSNGQLGTLTSSARFKYDIHDLGEKSDRLMELRPVTFRYKESADDGAHPLQYGLIAEEVAKIYPDLVQYDKQGKPFTVYYHLLTPMILNELQKAHQEINSLKSGQSQGAALVTQVHSLQRTVRVMLGAAGALILVCLIWAVGFLGGRLRPASVFSARPIDKCVS